MSGRAIAALSVVVFAAAVVALLPLAFGLRLLGAVVVTFAAAAGLWMLPATSGRHAVYYLRNSDGAVIYVGVTSPREGADDVLVSERIAEHLADIGEHEWKSAVVPTNCSVARYCITRRGALRSERRRIKTLVAAGPRRKRDGREVGWNIKTVPIHNDVHADKPGVPVLPLAWYLVESMLRVDARWHRPLVTAFPPAPPQPAEVERRAVVHVPQRDGDGIADFQADAAAAVRRRAQSQHPSADGGVSADVGDDGLTAEDIDRTISAVEGWLAAQTTTPPDGVGRDDGTAGPGHEVSEGTLYEGFQSGTSWDMGQVGHGTDQAIDGAGDDDPHPHTTPHTHDNGATSPPQPSALASEPTTPDNATDGGVEAADGQVGQTCIADGCDQPGNPRCGTHRKQWEAERKRRQRDRRKGKGDPTNPTNDTNEEQT